MKRRRSGIILMLTACMFACMPQNVYAEQTRFQQQIVPIECTQDTIANGEQVQVNITPVGCDNIETSQDLNTGTDSVFPANPSVVPAAPNTGVFSRITMSVQELGYAVPVVISAVLVLMLKVLQRFGRKLFT